MIIFQLCGQIQERIMKIKNIYETNINNIEQGYQKFGHL